MKKIILIIILFLIICGAVKVKGSQATTGVPYDTYTLGEYGKLVQTQTAFIPIGVFESSLDLKNPEDIFYHNQKFYIADSGNRRIVVLKQDGVIDRLIEKVEFETPTGVFVNNNYLFVADKKAQKVFKIDLNSLDIVQIIIKPTSPIYGQENSFTPTKVVVGNNDSIYIISEGSTNGVVQVNYAGEFVGYIGINTVSLSLRKLIYSWFVKDSKLASSLPPSPTNIALGAKGSIFTTNINVSETFKRLNISGINTLKGSTFYPKTNLADIWMSNDNYVYAVSSTGEVYEYDINGNLLFMFNTKDSSMTQTLGLTSAPSAVVTDDNGNLYVLDRVYNNVQVYQKTVFVSLVHEAVTLYNNGNYLESKPLWEEILRQNSSFSLAHSALGAAYTKEGRFEDALNEFYDAKDLNGYSNAFWEIRNVYIQKHLTTWIVILIIFFLLLGFVKRLGKKSQSYILIKEKVNAIKFKKIFFDLNFSLKILKKPDDVIYFVKRKEQGSYLSAFIIILLFLVVYLINVYLTGFLFRNHNNNQVFIQLLIVLGVFLIYVIVNYFISTFSDGEGRFKDIFIISSYILLPYIIFSCPMTIVSHILTYNEIFIYNFYNQIIVGWTIILFIYSIKEVHNYTFRESVKSIILIVFGMFIVILLGLLIYSFVGQLIDFIISVIKEVVYRA